MNTFTCHDDAPAVADETPQLVDCGAASDATQGITLLLLLEINIPPLLGIEL